MARKNVAELQGAVIDAIAENGPDVEFSVLADILTEGGNAEAVPMLRQMKHEGAINMRLERGPNGLEHLVSIANDGIPF